MDSQGRAGALPAEAARLGLSLPSWTGVRDEAVALLRQLIAADTSNPPGNETRAATVLQDYLGSAGIPSRLIGEEADRMNLLARVSAGRPGPRLLLLSHLDVVPALEADWEVPPFAGVVKDGCVWGRGARDMKNQTAAHAVALVRLVQSRRPFDGEVVLAATCDEEVTTRNGARWLLATHPGLLECDYLLTEPVVTSGPRANGKIQMLAVGEKTVAAFRVTVRGRSGHGSIPVHAESAVTRMAEVVRRLENARGDVTLSPVVREALGAIVPDDGLREGLLEARTASETLRELIEGDADLARCVEPLLGVTFSPSVVRCDSVAFNVIPGTVTLDVDCRLPPGQQPDEVRELVCRTLAGVPDWSFEWLEVRYGGESRAQGRLRDSIENTMEKMTPGTVVAATYALGGTDAPWFRQAMPGVVAYGFCPSFDRRAANGEGLLHVSNERIPVDDVGLQALFFETFLREILNCPEGGGDSPVSGDIERL